MSDWMGQYSAALDIRDAREQAHKQYIDACKSTTPILPIQCHARKLTEKQQQPDTRLADRTASASAPTPSTVPDPRNTVPAKSTSPSFFPSSPLPPTTTTTTTTATPTDILATLRADLSTTQKARQSLQNQVTSLTSELSLLQVGQRSSSSQIVLLSRQKADVERKLRDREEEIQAKAKLVTDAQDEMVALQLQLNMAEQRSDQLEIENKDLVDRWMKRMGEEAERLNRDSRWE